MVDYLDYQSKIGHAARPRSAYCRPARHASTSFRTLDIT